MTFEAVGEDSTEPDESIGSSNIAQFKPPHCSKVPTDRCQRCNFILASNPGTKFNGSDEEKLGQLIVTPEVVASKINNMNENKSPGVDGLSPKILKETVEQISKPLAHMFNMSLQEGIVPLEWKEANIIPLFKKG